MTLWFELKEGSKWQDYQKYYNGVIDNKGALGFSNHEEFDLSEAENNAGMRLFNRLWDSGGGLTQDEWGEYIRFYLKHAFDKDDTPDNPRGGGGHGGGGNNNNHKGGAPSKLGGSMAKYWDRADKDNNDTDNDDRLEGREAKDFEKYIKGDSRYRKLSNRDKDKVNDLLKGSISVDDALKIRSIFD